ncbi:MAG: ribonuclease III [Polyangiales bacterium]
MLASAMEREQAEAELMRKLGHPFADPQILRTALTHKSFRNENPRMAPSDNERLEFLGDALLGFVVASMLFKSFGAEDEGKLTRRRAALVSEAGLVPIARALGIGGALRLGRGEEHSGGRDKPRLLSSTFEACIGAICLDGGMEAAATVIQRLFDEPMRSDQTTDRKDSKSRVQEWLQSQGKSAPDYEVLSADGPITMFLGFPSRSTAVKSFRRERANQNRTPNRTPPTKRSRVSVRTRNNRHCDHQSRCTLRFSTALYFPLIDSI